jgi:hypothetical protein
MPNDLSLVVSQVISHTPRWVWGVLIAITVIGIKQMAQTTVSRTRLAAVPALLGALSLGGVAAAFGARAEVLVAWGLGVALVVAASQWLVAPTQARQVGAGRYSLPGSVWPLLAMWSMFALRYITSVALVLHPGWKQGTLFALLMPMACGALSGLFLARSLRVLRHAPAAASLRLA